MKKGKNICIITLLALGTVLFIQAEGVCAAGFGDHLYKQNEYYYFAENRLPAPGEAKSGGVPSTSLPVHKIFGYSTLAFGLAAMTTGIIDRVDRERGRVPSHARQVVHSVASYGTAALAIGACTSGFVQYGNIFSLDKGMAKYNAHAILGIVSTTGFIGSIISAKIDRRNEHKSSRNNYVHHTWAGAGSGAVMMISLVVLCF
ncbi:MAG: hypothetical protein KA369_19130 [Spirochaetes bacterium]|nr:hypothetical protein [Spirochaetota bacterium]